jgi:hypothetical protein
MLLIARVRSRGGIGRRMGGYGGWGGGFGGGGFGGGFGSPSFTITTSATFPPRHF